MPPLTSPHDPRFAALCDQLAALAPSTAATNAWPAEQLRLLAEAGVFAWFVPRDYAGLGWEPADLTRGYMRLAQACLTTAFILTQWAAGCRRVAVAAFDTQKTRLLPALARGEHFTTIAISHLTTSRRHLGQPAMLAEETDAGFVLNGYSPWVTGAAHADSIVMGAELADGRQILVTLPAGCQGVSFPPASQLVALTASCTGEVRCHGVHVPREFLLHGPVRNVMQMGSGGGTGGLQTSALAAGLASAAVAYLGHESRRRPDLEPAYAVLQAEADLLSHDLLASANGEAADTLETLRTRANSLVLRATQAALVAAKGSGFAASHNVGRWCREALFFLVWSCPQTVANAQLCSLAGMEE